MPPEQSIWSHHQLRGPRRGSPQGSRDQRHHQLVDTLQAYSRGSNAISGGGSNANSGGQSRNASRAVDLEPPPAERTSTGVTTGFGGPAVEGSSDTIAPVGRQSSTRASTTRTSAAYSDTRVLPMQQRVRPARREPIVILPTPVRVTRTAAQ